jgi:hypothetical protein
MRRCKVATESTKVWKALGGSLRSLIATGTWVPLADGRDLADRYGVLPQLLPIFDYVAGDKSPPPAPKHTTAASNKSKVQKVPAPSRKAASKPTSSLI